MVGSDVGWQGSFLWRGSRWCWRDVITDRPPCKPRSNNYVPRCKRGGQNGHSCKISWQP